MSIDLSVSAIGLAVGFLVGLTGVGGAAILTPILIWIGFPATIAVGTDLFYNSITKLFGGLQHWRQRTVQWKLVAWFAAGSVPGAVVAVGLLRWFEAFFHDQEQLIRTALGIMLIVVAASTLLRLLGRGRAADHRWQAKPAERKRLATIVIGFVLGFVVGLTSVGSGSLFAIALLTMYRLKPAEVVGTDIVHAFFLVTAAGALHAGLGHVDYGLAFQLLLGSVPGVLLGSTLSAKVPAKPLRAVVATMILFSGLKLL